MRRYEDYSCWSRYLPLVNWMTRTLDRIIEKGISSVEICCGNVQLEIKLYNITHTWCSSVFARSLNKAIRQKPSITQYELWKNVYTLSRPAEKKLPSVESRCTIYSYFTFPKPTVESRALCFPLQGTNISY